MSDVKVTRVRSRLSALALGRGGITAKLALDRADRAIDSINHTLIEAIDAILAEMDARFGDASPNGGVGDYEGLYRLAASIIDVSACLKGSMLDKAAYALCDMVDLSAERGVWDRQAVEVHIMVLRLLRHGGEEMSQVRRQRVVEGLFMVTAKRVGDIKEARDAKTA